jgi:DNA phosphorothioation-associated putative methyltransferase
MEFKTFTSLVKQVSIGKHLPEAIYIHQSAFDCVPKDLLDLITRVSSALKIERTAWNILKLSKRDFKISLLNYPDFEGDSYPALHTSFTIDLQKLSFRKAEYGKTENPPILHRKETFVSDEYPLLSLFREITREGEAIGLYENVRSIGFKSNWLRLISSKGYELNAYGRLIPKHERKSEHVKGTVLSGPIQRHLTAIDRHKLSNPMQIIARHNYLDGEMSVLDFGCGKGDDVRELEAHGIDVSGWDPVHNPEGILINSDIVNLGFVLNVIEDREERDETLRRAWGYADSFLVASVMIAGESFIQQFTPYRDGVVTSRNTFQRYYTQSEFRAYLESVLEENAVAVGQGVFIVFKDKMEEQKFLLERQHIKRDWTQRTQREQKSPPREINKNTIEIHSELFTDFWNTALDLGRIPANDEFEHSTQLRKLMGSHLKATQALTNYHGPETLQRARIARTDDLLVYFALGLFEKRKAYKHMPEGLKRDIKAFFGTVSEAVSKATEVLFSVGNSNLIEQSATEAFGILNTGEFNHGHSWVIHKDVLSDLPPVLRIYVGCATQLYGDLSNIQLVKIHFTSGKVSLMAYDDWAKDTPLLVERIKIKMRDQDVDFFDYVGRFEPPPLANKSQFLNRS